MFRTLVLALVVLLMVGCSAAPAPTPVPPAPTAVPAAPTALPAAPTAAPAAPTAAPAAPTASGAIEFFFPESPGLKEGFTGVAAAFQAKYPSVTVNIRTVPFNQYKNQVTVMLASDNVADVILPGAPEISNLAANDAIQTLDDVLPASAYADFAEASIGALLYQGKIYAYPWRESAIAMFYNTDMFAAAGVTAPKTLDEAWTWAEWLENIQKVVAAAEAKQAGEKVWGTVWLSNPPTVGTGDYWWNIMVRSAGAKGSPTFQALSPDGVKVGGYLDTPEAIEALHFFQDLFVKHELAPQAEVPDAFGTGKSATMISFVQTGTTLKGNFKDLKWDVMPLPYHVTPMTHTGGFTIAVTRKAKNVEAAKLFVDYAGSEEGLVTFFKTAGAFMTARKSLLGQTEWFKEPYQQLFIDELVNWGVPRPSSPAYPVYDAGLGQLYRDIALGSDVEETVAAVVADLDSQLPSYK